MTSVYLGFFGACFTNLVIFHIIQSSICTMSLRLVACLVPVSGLATPAPDIRASQEDLTVMIRKQSQRAQNLFGEDKNKQRRRTMSRDLERQVSPEVIAYRKRTALERTLRVCDMSWRCHLVYMGNIR